MWDASLKTDATVEPVSLEEAKAHLRVDWADDDDYISSIVKAARQVCEDYSGRAFLKQTWVMKLSHLEKHVSLVRPKLISVASVKYLDAQRSVVELTKGTGYYIDADVQPALIYVPHPPTSYASDKYPVTIEFDCGYGIKASDVPERIKQAILLQTGHFYENRENIIVGQGIAQYKLLQGAQYLLDFDRITPL